MTTTPKLTSNLPAEPNEISNPSLASPADRQMDRQLLEACSEGKIEMLKALVHRDPNILTSVTPDGNNCLHLATMLGYHEFAAEVWSRDPSLFCSTNKQGETPLVVALAAANDSLASAIIDAATQHLQPDITHGMEGGKPLNEMLLKFDIRGDSVLHHAMRNGFEEIAVQLFDIEPRLSEQVNKSKESPMFMAARRGYSEVLQRLLQIPSSANSGPDDYTALHAAVDAGRTG
jgi:ankyrin repeat protein